MTWTKLSDDFSDDCWQLSDAAWRLHVEGLIWSNRKLLDLRLDKDDVRRWAKHPEAADELVERGWWVDCGDHYRMVHHACYQRTAEEVLAQQERSRTNGMKGGRPPREQAPRKRSAETQNETQLRTQIETQMGSEDDDSGDGEPRAKPRQVTQLPTQGDRTGQDRPGLGKQPPTEDSTEKTRSKPGCSSCASNPAQGEPHPFPHLCADCLEAAKHPSMKSGDTEQNHDGAVALLQQVFPDAHTMGNAHYDRDAAYRNGMCVDCGDYPHSAGRPRCNECHRIHTNVMAGYER